MSDDTPGAEQGALPLREAQAVRPAAERPATMRLTQVPGGQYVLTSQSGLPALAQITSAGLSGVQGGVTRIISISPSRGHTSPLRPSLTNQSIVNVLKSRGNPNVRLQLFQGNESSSSTSNTSGVLPRAVKRPASTTPEKKDSYSTKMERLMNHRIVRSKLVKEKYAEHLLEAFYLEAGGNILDLYQYAKRPKSQAYLTYMNEHSIDPKEYAEDPPPIVTVPQTTPSTPSATSVNSLPGISQSVQEPASNSSLSNPATPESSTTLPQTRTTLTGSSSQELLVEKAKQEAYVVQRIADLQKEGLWSERRLPKVQEMPRGKAHWDFLLEEMVWLAADFAQERKWKKAAAKKCARMVQKYFQDKALAAQRAEKAHEQHLKRIAAFCAKEIKTFWGNVEKLVEYKQNTILEEKRKKALDQQLSFIVDQTEKYSQLLAEGMNKSSVEVASSNISPQSASRPQSDDEFDPEMQSEEDDEETIEQEEAAVETAEQTAEVEALQKESQLELDDLLEDDILRNYLMNRDTICLGESDDSDDDDDSDTKKRCKDEKSESSDSDYDDSQSENENIEAENSLLEDQSIKMLVDEEPQKEQGDQTKTDDKDDLINDAAAIAESIQPKGNTLSSTTVSTKVPFLLKLPLREYQHIGLDWLVTMYERKLNGILADEMGLGKTIQTIALLAHLACEKENWGPHLIVVPTSVMLNWEMECKKWCPAFKILTYYGTQKERKQKRTGWTKPNTFHICITSYKLVIQDHQSFRRKKWKYLILDEAQNIKNFKSQRWQLLLNFQTERRLLLTGTPLQNNLMELWSLMHFLMPNVFQSHREFKEWFSNPVTGMIEGNSEYNDSIIKRLHKVLRPFLLRRLKSEVEKQMPKKYEHVVMCRLSKRQRFLYDDYMSRAKTRETLASGNLLSVINILMQLRKVCNHPNLFEVRPTISPFQCDNIKVQIPSIVYSALQYDVFKHVNFYAMNFLIIMLEMHLGAYQCYRMKQSAKKSISFEQGAVKKPTCPPCKLSMKVKLRGDIGEIKQEDKKDQVQLTKSATPASVKLKVPGIQLVTPGMVKSGQKITFLSKQPISAGSNTTQAITKAYVKFQLTSDPNSPASNSSAAILTKEDGLRSVNSKFLGQLYSKQNSLDVRWKKDDRRTGAASQDDLKQESKRRLQLMTRINEKRCSALPLYGRDFQEVTKIYNPNSINPWNGGYINCLNVLFKKDFDESTTYLADMLYSPERRITQLKEICDRFIFYVPAVKSNEPEVRVFHPPPSEYWSRKEEKLLIQRLFSKPATPLHHIASAMVTQFPDPRLIQYDCGKLQTLDRLLRRLKTGSHRVLIFTQMTKMLDVLEAFLNFHGHIYLRLDGTTKVDQRQALMERFNGDKRIFAFILSTRSGGVGVNLTGADTVIFYDSDWNPTMDAQAQDRCHRIGQTRDVHIYRLVSERTVEENILKKANQKRLLGDLAIEGGNFTTAYFKSTTIQDLFTVDQTVETAAQRMSEIVDSKKEKEKPSNVDDLGPDDKSAVGALENALAACEDDQDVQAAKTAKAEAVADLAEFDENIPLDQESEKDKEPEVSKAEQEINSIIDKLSPIEKYALKFIEQTESAWSAEQLAAAERQIEEQKREWELNQMAAMREEEERRARELEEENDIITYSRDDATNQVSLKSKKLIKSKKLVKRRRGKIKLLKNKRIRRRKMLKSKRLLKVETTLNDVSINEVNLDAKVSNSKHNDQAVIASDGEESSSSENPLSESDLSLSELKQNKSNNHIDHNSPRTRSRGTVAINLWTLDVSPILPGVKPIKNNKFGYTKDAEVKDKKIPKKHKAISDDEKILSGDASHKRIKKIKAKKCESTVNCTNANAEETQPDLNGIQNDSVLEENNVHLSTNKVCKVVLSDIIADGQYKIPENVDSSDDSLCSSETSKFSHCDVQKREEDSGTCYDKLTSQEESPLGREKNNLDAEENSHSTASLGESIIEKNSSDAPEELGDASLSGHKNTNDPSPSNNSFLDTNGYVEKNEDLEMPKENIESPNISKPLLGNDHNSVSKHSTNIHFKSPEPRKTYRKFMKCSNNKTLDGWVMRGSPASKTTKTDPQKETMINEVTTNESLKESEK